MRDSKCKTFKVGVANESLPTSGTGAFSTMVLEIGPTD